MEPLGTDRQHFKRGLAGQVEPSGGNPRDAAEALSDFAVPTRISVFVEGV